MTRVAIFGGSFNPPHVAHVLLALYVRSVAPVDSVVVVPVYKHPFSKGLEPFDDRLRMCEAAFRLLPWVTVSTVERDLGGESLTLHTLERFREVHPDWQMRLVIGSDVVADFDKWHRFDLVQKLAEPLVVPRAGAPVADDAGKVFLPEISSSEVRRLIKAGRSGALDRMVPKAVLDYIEEHRLYAAPA